MKKNVLLLSMSTFPGVVKNNYYYATDSINQETDYYVGKSQLEPLTKHIVRMLAKKQEKLDKIIILATYETWYENSEEKAKKFDGEDLTPVEYYKKKIKTYLKKEEKILLDEVAVWTKTKNLNLDEVKNSLELAKEGGMIRDLYHNIVEDDNFFTAIKMDQSEQLSYEAVPKIVEQIREMGKDVEGVNLYLDMQGGSRITSFITNAAVNMLKSQNVELKNSYHILFDFKNPPSEIKDESMANHVFDLVSGMDEFLSYGKGKKFKQYFDFYKKNHMQVGDDCPEDELVDKIVAISEYISVCNMEGFMEEIDGTKGNHNNKAVRSLEGVLERYKNTKDKKNPLFKSFIQNLEETYQLILKPDRKATDVIAWCLERELYQQALTVCESKIPDQFVKEGILYYCRSEEEKEEFLDRLAKKYKDKGGEEWFRGGVSMYVMKSYNFGKFKKTKKIRTRPEEIIHMLKETKELYTQCDLRNEGTDNYKKLMKLYEKNRKNRNHVNHGDGIGLKVVKETLEMFLESYGKLRILNRDVDILTIEIDDVEKRVEELQ